MALADQYSKVGGGLAPKIPQFEKVLPWEKLWGGVEQPMMESAYSMVTPELQRQYNTSARDYTMNLANTGGGAFGRGWGGMGSMQARAERQRKEQGQDWLNTYRDSMKEWYNQTKGRYQQAALSGNKFKFKVPTWQSMAKKMGGSTQSGSQWMKSPFIGTAPTRRETAKPWSLGAQSTGYENLAGRTNANSVGPVGPKPPVVAPPTPTPTMPINRGRRFGF